MLKHICFFAAFASLPLAAQADRTAPLPGDENFVLNANPGVDNGSDFSYARKWRTGRAYDGTDTSRFFEKTRENTPPSNDANLRGRQNYITRDAAPATEPKSPRVILLRGRHSD